MMGGSPLWVQESVRDSDLDSDRLSSSRFRNELLVGVEATGVSEPVGEWAASAGGDEALTGVNGGSLPKTLTTELAILCLSSSIS
jgi:hypothetical protein